MLKPALDEALRLERSDGELALRTVKLLCLLAASPLERPRTAAEPAFMLLSRVSDLDPAANAVYLERAVLEPAVPGGPGAATYRVELGADASLVARDRVAQARPSSASPTVG